MPDIKTVLTDQQIEDAQGRAFQELSAKGYNGGMGGRQWDRASARAIEAAVLAASSPALVKPKPPKWYDREEMVMLLRHMNYCEVIAQELADWMVRHLQFAFNKGFQVRGWREYTGRPTEFIYPPQPAMPDAAKDAEDAKMLDFMIEHEAWVTWSRDRECCRVFSRDEEGNVAPMTKWGAGLNFDSGREAIRAAIAAANAGKDKDAV